MADWELLPNSRLTGALAPLLPFGGGSDPAVSLTDAYCSAVLDGLGRFILPRNGGHGDGAHNGTRAFNTVTNQWALLTPDSTAYLPIGGTLTQPAANYHSTYPDGTPASVHAYDAMCYMPTVNRIWSAGGIYWSPPGNSDTATWEFDLSTNTWIDVPNRSGGYTCMSVWDPVTARVLFITSGGFYAYDPASRTYTTFFSATGPNTLTSGLALDAARRLLYWVPNHAAAPFRIMKIDLNNLTAKHQTVIVTGNTEIGATRGLGLFFHGDLLVAYGRNATNNGGTLYTCDPAALPNPVWSRLTTGGVTPPLPTDAGTWKKFCMHPNGYVHYLHSTGIYRILPDFGSIPSTITVKVAASYTVDYVSTPPTPPDPPGGNNPLPLNTWTFVPPIPAGTPSADRIGKHHRLLRDTLRNRWVLTAGDSMGSEAGQPAVHVWDYTTGIMTNISPSCIAAPGIVPNWPDNVVWVHDTRRDKYLMFRGFYMNTEPSAHARPNATITLSGTTGTVIATQGAGSDFAFAAWMEAGLYGSDKYIQTYTAPGGSTSSGKATITRYLSPTQVECTVTTTFAALGPLPATQWLLGNVIGGKYDSLHNESGCGFRRNFQSGDTNVIHIDCMYNPATNKWEHRDWETSPAGIGSDGSGPGHGVYDETTDSVYMYKSGVGMQILHRGTNTWDIVALGAGMATSAEKTLVTSSNAYRSVFVQVNRSLFGFSIRGLGQQAFIEYLIDQKTWHAYGLTAAGLTYKPPVDDSIEQSVVYDPVSNVVIHLNSYAITGDIEEMFILDVSTKAITKRTFAVIAPGGTNQPIRNGYPFWNAELGALGIMGRKATGVTGVFCWHYRYGP